MVRAPRSAREVDRGIRQPVPETMSLFLTIDRHGTEECSVLIQFNGRTADDDARAPYNQRTREMFPQTLRWKAILSDKGEHRVGIRSLCRLDSYVHRSTAPRSAAPHRAYSTPRE